MRETRSTDYADLQLSTSAVEYSGNQPDAGFEVSHARSDNQPVACIVDVDTLSDLKVYESAMGANDEAASGYTRKPRSVDTVEKPYALTRFPIDAEDPFSIMLLMCCHHWVMFAVIMIRLLPVVIMALLAVWFGLIVQKNEEEWEGEPPIKYGFYKVIVQGVDHAVISLVYFGIFIPKILQFFSPVKHFIKIKSFIGNASSNDRSFRRKMLGCAVVCFIIDLVIAPLISMGLSLFIAIYLSEGSLLNVLLNAAVLEFVNELDAAILSTGVDEWYRGASVAILINQYYRSRKWGS
eukprot:GEMP01044881.1.p1 GENE.GEMP01044881.1~~GEMP01044881.1.p1  ORF type:complete len:294 (+),score=44.56 GEMP01044881.1:232-1113(+)